MWPGIARLQSACLGMILLDIETLSAVEEHLFSQHEAERAARMGLRRRREFTAARVALKRLARQLDLVEENRPDQSIETLGSDHVRPCLGESAVHCSVSHSARWVVAVAHRHPIGVDIEMVSEKPIRTGHLFLSPGERDLISLSPLGPQRAATRAWTIKEAAAKALSLGLFEAMREVRVVRLGEEEGAMSYQGKLYAAGHSEGNGYVIALIACDDDCKASGLL